MYCVVTPTGCIVFEGSESCCQQYISQALLKGSPAGFLAIELFSELSQ